MTAFDYAVLGVVTASAALGFWRGVVSEVLALLAWIVAFVAARQWSGAVAESLGGLVAEPVLRYAAALAMVLVGVLLLFAIARRLLAALLRAAGLGPADRVLGAGFGVARGLLIVLVAVLLAGMTALPKSQWWRDARLAPPLETAVIAAKPWLPEQVGRRIHYR